MTPMLTCRVEKDRRRELIRVTLPREMTLAEIERFAGLAGTLGSIGTMEAREFLFTPYNGFKCALLFEAGFTVGANAARHVFRHPMRKRTFSMAEAVIVAKALRALPAGVET